MKTKWWFDGLKNVLGDSKVFEKINKLSSENFIICENH